MGKKIIILIFTLVVVFLVITKEKDLGVKPEIENTPSPTGIVGKVSDEKLIPYDEFNLVVTGIKIEDISGVSLIPNFTQEFKASEILEKYQCKKLVNAGFYTQGREPIGMFVTNNKTLSGYQTNNTLNGVLSIGGGVTNITYSQPSDSDIAVQTGPVIIFDSDVVKLNLQRDFYARRMVAATDEVGNLYFFVVYNPQSSIQGPNLADLGEVIFRHAKENGINISTAINMDGGGASAFFSDDVILEEVVPVGGAFCIK